MAVRDVVQAAAGQGGDKLYVEDVFSTYLYTGTATTLNIENNIDLAGEGGLTWIKSRSSGSLIHVLHDTERGAPERLNTASSDVQATMPAGVGVTSFNSNGFTLGTGTNYNSGGGSYASWTFRKAPKFFDVVTWTGNSTPRTIAHNLGSVPGCIFVKRLDGLSSDWNVYHRSLGNSARLLLNSTAQSYDIGNVCWNSTDPTDTVFSLGTNSGVNTNGATYVAYVFAHDAGGFGDDGEQNVISCGSYTATGNDDIELGFEPQWVLHKRANTDSAWYIQDVQRGMALTESKHLSPNTATAEGTFSGNITSPTATGFHNGLWGSGTIIYIAIRRPMKTPESGGEVFAPIATTTGQPSYTFVSTGFPIDLQIMTPRAGSNFPVVDRLRGISTTTTESGALIQTCVANAESTYGYSRLWDSEGFTIPSIYGSTNVIYWSFKRAPGFMDQVCYTGTGVARTVAHNLGVAPELIVLKHRNGADNWVVGHKQFNWLGPVYLNESYGYIGDNIAWWNNTAPTTTEFTIGYSAASNTNTGTYVAYLFASLPGVSKVGSYSGTGGNVNVDCGFSAGARFVLIKRTDSTGDWYVWDSARGIAAGNDPYLRLNSTAAEVTSTDYIDPLASGFTVTSSAPAALNASGGTYIFLAIA